MTMPSINSRPITSPLSLPSSASRPASPIGASMTSVGPSPATPTVSPQPQPIKGVVRVSAELIGVSAHLERAGFKVPARSATAVGGTPLAVGASTWQRAKAWLTKIFGIESNSVNQLFQEDKDGYLTHTTFKKNLGTQKAVEVHPQKMANAAFNGTIAQNSFDRTQSALVSLAQAAGDDRLGSTEATDQWKEVLCGLIGMSLHSEWAYQGPLIKIHNFLEGTAKSPTTDTLNQIRELMEDINQITEKAGQGTIAWPMPRDSKAVTDPTPPGATDSAPPVTTPTGPTQPGPAVPGTAPANGTNGQNGSNGAGAASPGGNATTIKDSYNTTNNVYHYYGNAYGTPGLVPAPNGGSPVKVSAGTQTDADGAGPSSALPSVVSSTTAPSANGGAPSSVTPIAIQTDASDTANSLVDPSSITGSNSGSPVAPPVPARPPVVNPAFQAGGALPGTTYVTVHNHPLQAPAGGSPHRFTSINVAPPAAGGTDVPARTPPRYKTELLVMGLNTPSSPSPVVVPGVGASIGGAGAPVIASSGANGHAAPVVPPPPVISGAPDSSGPGRLDELYRKFAEKKLGRYENGQYTVTYLNDEISASERQDPPSRENYEAQVRNARRPLATELTELERTYIALGMGRQGVSGRYEAVDPTDKNIVRRPKFAAAVAAELMKPGYNQTAPQSALIRSPGLFAPTSVGEGGSAASGTRLHEAARDLTKALSTVLDPVLTSQEKDLKQALVNAARKVGATTVDLVNSAAPPQVFVTSPSGKTENISAEVESPMPVSERLALDAVVNATRLSPKWKPKA